MKKVLISSLLFSLSSCSTTSPWRSISSLEDHDSYFKDVTVTANVGTAGSSSVTTGDFNNDGLVDFIAHNRLYKNISTKDLIRFEDVTDKMKLSEMKGRPIFIDVDNDGQLDIMTTANQFFRQHSNSFQDLAKRYALRMDKDAYTISYGDLNGDGFADILVGKSEYTEKGQFKFRPPQIFMNMMGLTFKETSMQQLMSRYPAYTRGIVWADYNNDQSPDIYFSNYRLKENFLFKINKGQLTDTAAMTGVRGEKDNNRYYDAHMNSKYGPRYGHTIGSVWADLDNDGNLDLWVSNLVHKFVGKTNKGSYDIRGYVCDDSKVYKNTGAPHYNFVDTRKISNLPVMPMGDYTKFKGDELWAHSTAADFDNDGLIDMYVSQVYNLKYAHSLLFRNAGNFKFENHSKKGPMVIDSYAGAWADFNNDGKMDLVVSGREKVDAPQELRIFQNVMKTGNNYLKVKLTGTKSGKNPVTTQVRVFHSKGVFLRQVEGVTGTHNQQNDPTLHFGLGKISKIDRIEISWSSGEKQVIKNVKVNSTQVIAER